MLLAVVGFHISWRSDKKLMAVSALSLSLEWSDLSVAMVPIIIQTLAPSVICGFPAVSDLLLIDAPSGIRVDSSN